MLTFDLYSGRGSFMRDGELGTGKKAERMTVLRSYFFSIDGMGTELTLEELVATEKFGPENTIREALKQGVEEDWLYYVAGGTGQGDKSRWRLVQQVRL